MRKRLVLSIAIISLAILGGYVTSVADGDSGLEPPPMGLADQVLMPVGDQNGPMVCGGKTVTVGYVREQVMKLEPMPPPPAEQDGSASPSTDPVKYLPDNPVGEQAIGPSYVFRCVNDQVVAIPAP